MQSDRDPRRQPATLWESREHLPPIYLNFFFAAHRTARDYEAITPHFMDSDIYIPEALGGGARELAQYQAASNAGSEVSMYFGKSIGAREHEIRMIQGSRKPIVFVDTAMDHPATRAFAVGEKAADTTDQYFLDGRIEMTLRELPSAVQQMVTANISREQYIRQQLARQVPRAIMADRRLRVKPRVNVLVSLGGAHFNVFRKLKKLDHNDRVHALTQLNIEQNTRIQEAIYLGSSGQDLATVFDATYIARMALENILISRFGGNVIDDTVRLCRIVRYLADQFSVDEIVKISRNLMTIPANMKDEAIQSMVERKAKLPKFTSVQQVYDFIDALPT